VCVAVSRSLLLEKPGSWRIATTDLRDPGPGEALVHVVAAGVCRRDLALFEGGASMDPRAYPVVPGHEWSGTVLRVGRGVDRDLVEAHVTGEGVYHCQACDRCLEGDTNLCEDAGGEIGLTEPGAFADRLLIPARLLHRLDPQADLVAAALMRPAANAAAAVLRAGVRPGDRVAVVGAGTLGVLVIQLLAARVPAELIAVDPRGSRAEQALAAGAASLVAPGAAGERFDVVIEAAGAPASACEAMSLTRRGGTLVLAGRPAGQHTPLPPGEVISRQLTIHTVSGAHSAAWAYAVRAYNSGLLALRPLITHELPLEAYGDAMALLADPATGKVVLRP
jgi:Threonine dehydrogenase and related Zn-dependent dehydrogenases